MPRELIDLLWRDHPDAPRGGTRGPRTRLSTSQVVDAAVALADAEGLAAVTVRRLAADLGSSVMTLYSHVGAREDLLVLMADAAVGSAPHPPLDGAWRGRVRRLARAELDLHVAHPWLLDVTDQRTALGPGTIARYDHGLHAFDPLGLADLDRDAALTFVLDFARGAARARRPDSRAPTMDEVWRRWSARLAGYLGDGHPLAQRVGAAAGEEMSGPSSPAHAWDFGLARVLDALAALPGAGA